jgi:hypothetical protein
VSWVREHWPPNARLIVTTTPGGPAADLAELTGMASLPLPPLDEREARGIVAAVFARYHRHLPPSIVDELVARHAASELPLWLILAGEELNLLDADDFARAHRTYDGSPEERIAALLRDRVAGLPDDVDGLYRAAVRRSEQMFGRAQTAAFLGAIAVSRLGLRETDFRSLLPALGHTDWDELRFAQLRRIFRGQLRQREPLGRWDFDHRQMRKAVRGWLTDIGVQERDLHGAIADHLLALPADDSARISDVMLHVIEAENWPRACAALAALDDDKVGASLNVLVKQLRSPTERPRDEAARRLVRALTASDVDDVTLSRAADRMMEVYLSAQGRSSSTAEKIILSAVDECLRAITTRRPHDRETLHRHATCLTFWATSTRTKAISNALSTPIGRSRTSTTVSRATAQPPRKTGPESASASATYSCRRAHWTRRSPSTGIRRTRALTRVRE